MRDVLPQLAAVEAPVWAPATRTEELALELSAGAVPTVQQVVDVFDATVAAMPGATPSPLPDGDGFPGTSMFALVSAVREQLTSQQLAVVEAHGFRDADGGRVDLIDVAVSASVGIRRTAPRPAEPVQDRYHQVLKQVVTDWNNHRPDLTIMPVVFSIEHFQVKNYLMTAEPVQLDGRTKCHIKVFPAMHAPDQSDEWIKLVFAHELFHCIQFGWRGGGLVGVPQWLSEGSADFAANDLYRDTFDQSASFNNAWFDAPDTALGARIYSAWPLYEIVRQSGQDAYDAIRAMLTTGQDPTVPGTTTFGVEARLAAGGIGDLTLRMNWNAMTLRSSSFGTSFWAMGWPVPGGTGGPQDNTSVYEPRAVGEYPVVGGGEYGQPQVTIAVDEAVGLVFVSTGDAPMTTHAEAGTVTVPEHATGRFCFDRDRCPCPEGTTAGALQMVGRDMVFSYPASDDVPESSVQAVPWDPELYCDDESDPRAELNGDPHLVSFDGLAFDVMALGEFVAARDSDGGFEVQARFVPAAHVGASTSAVALSDGEHRITFTALDLRASTEIVVRVDGVDAGDEAVDEPVIGAGTMTATSNSSPYDWTITWPDGSSLELWWAQGWFVGLSVPEERAGRLEGLLSAPNHDVHDDLRLPDGTSIDARESGAVDGRFAPAWRVDDETTLFDYAPGQNPSAFVGPPATPEPDVDLGDAFSVCADALGDDAPSFHVDSCAFDVTVGASDTAVFDYDRVAEARADAQPAPLAPLSTDVEAPQVPSVPTEPAAPDGPVLTISGRLYSGPPPDDDLVGVRELSGSVTLVAGAVLIARTADCSADANALLLVTNRESGLLSAARLCDAMRLNRASADVEDEVVNGEAYVWAASGGVYDVTVSTDEPGPATMSVDFFADRTPTVVAADDFDRDGFRGSVDGVGDTVVIVAGTGSEFVSWIVSGLGNVCADDVYGVGPIGQGAPVPLAFCGHPSDVAILPGKGIAVHVIVFSRTSDTTQFELSR